MGFLWFNVHPAQIFMGDSGALGLGATLAVVATLSGQLPLLVVIGIVFFAVIMSVVLQVAQLPAARAGASSAWRRCSTTSSSSAGRRRRSRSASGSWRRWPGCSASASSWLGVSGLLAGPMMAPARAPIRTAEDLRGRRTAVLGLARSGVAASRFLADAGAVVMAYDRRPAAELADAVAALGARPVRLALGVDETAAAGAAGARRPGRHQPIDLAALPDHRAVAARGAGRRRGARRAELVERGRPLPAPDARAGPGRDRHQGQDDHHRR